MHRRENNLVKLLVTVIITLLIQGDSGGPLVNSDGIVIGTVSAGPVPCNKPKGPAMFANVRFFRNWVRKYANWRMQKTN